MLLLVSDENFNNDIVRGLLRRNPALDIVRVQDIGLRGEEDPVILAWAANEGRVVLTHDAATMAYFAYERVKAGLSMPGVIEVADDLPLSHGNRRYFANNGNQRKTRMGRSSHLFTTLISIRFNFAEVFDRWRAHI